MTTENHFSGLPENFEKELFETLKQYGFDLTKSEGETQALIDSFGETKMELPESLSNSDKLFDLLNSALKKDRQNVYAFAARGQALPNLPDSVLQKMKSDISTGKRVKTKSTDGGRQKKPY